MEHNEFKATAKVTRIPRKQRITYHKYKISREIIRFTLYATATKSGGVYDQHHFNRRTVNKVLCKDAAQLMLLLV